MAWPIFLIPFYIDVRTIGFDFVILYTILLYGLAKASVTCKAMFKILLNWVYSELYWVGRVNSIAQVEDVGNN